MCVGKVRRRFNTYPVRRSCGVDGGVHGELASLNELPSEAHCRFLTACSRFSVERLRLGLIVCKGTYIESNATISKTHLIPPTYTETGSAQFAQIDAAK